MTDSKKKKKTLKLNPSTKQMIIIWKTVLAIPNHIKNNDTTQTGHLSKNYRKYVTFLHFPNLILSTLIAFYAIIRSKGHD